MNIFQYASQAGGDQALKLAMILADIVPLTIDGTKEDKMSVRSDVVDLIKKMGAGEVLFGAGNYDSTLSMIKYAQGRIGHDFPARLFKRLESKYLKEKKWIRPRGRLKRR